MTMLSITTANIPPGAEAAFAHLHADVILTQENQERRVDNYLSPKIYRNFQLTGGAAGRTGVSLLKRRFQPLQVQPVELSQNVKGVDFPSEHRVALAVRARDMYTGRYATFMSVHLVPHADDPEGGITDFPRGPLLVTPSITNMLRYFTPDALGAEFVGGDFNIDFNKDRTHKDPTDLLERANRAHFVADGQIFPHSLPTHGKETLDWIFMRFQNKYWTPIHVDVEANRPSDHRMKTLLLSVKPRKGWTPVVLQG